MWNIVGDKNIPLEKKLAMFMQQIIVILFYLLGYHSDETVHKLGRVVMTT